MWRGSRKSNPLSNEKLKNIRTVIFVSLLLIAAFLLLVWRCFWLQHFRSEHYRSVSIKQQKRYDTQRPQRGVILDCRGSLLAASNKIQTLFADPLIIKDPKDVSNKLEPVLDMGAHEICKLITESGNPRFVTLKSGATPAQCAAVRGKMYGIGINSDWRRYYPMGRLASNIVGFTNTDNHGLEGIEFEFDEQLSGTAGRSIFLADSGRRPIRLKAQDGVLSDGTGIILTLDATIQQFARAELLKQYQSYEAESAVAIVAEPRTGAILAMVSLPDFDPNGIRSTDPNNFRNRAISDQFEPGSIIKPIVAAIALDAGVVNTHEKIFCENGNYYGKGFGRIGEYRRGFGDLTVREILIHSSNIGMAKVGQRLGKDKLYEGLRLFGFGKKTGVELPGEVAGLVWPVSRWTGYSVTRIPFGQEITVTAIQLLRAFCTLANGGCPVRPYLVKAMVDNDGKITKLRRRPAGVGFVVSPEVAHWVVREALVGVVNEGTGKRARLGKWQVFGKTGTANIAKSDSKGYSESNYVASFVAGAPAEEPRVLVLVSIRKPNKSLGKGYTGGAVASPVAAKIIEKTLTYLENIQR